MIRRVILRTACGCERMFTESVDKDESIPQTIVIPCVPDVAPWYEQAPDQKIKVTDRYFKLDKKWIGPAQTPILVYQEVI